eukprot:COSAG06_NODE_7474_length_2491_cov_29.073997_2_plen_80_part_00
MCVCARGGRAHLGPGHGPGQQHDELLDEGEDDAPLIDTKQTQQNQLISSYQYTISYKTQQNQLISSYQYTISYKTQHIA